MTTEEQFWENARIAKDNYRTIDRQPWRIFRNRRLIRRNHELIMANLQLMQQLAEEERP